MIKHELVGGFMRVKYVIIPMCIAFCATNSCGGGGSSEDNNSTDNPENSPVIKQVEATAPSSKEVTTSAPPVGGIVEKTASPVCLDNCTATPTPTQPDPLSFSTTTFFTSTSDCQMDTPQIVKSKHLDKITVFYRAKYASTGLWQLYIREVSINEDGTSSLVGTEPTNLLPTCFGNASGVTGFNFTELKTNSGNIDVGKSVTEVDDVSDIKLSITCINPAQSSSKTISLTNYDINNAAVTNAYKLNTGFWKAKNVYVMPDGTTFKSDRSAGNITIPGNWSSSGTSPKGLITHLFGEDSNGIYVEVNSTTNSCYYIKNDLSIATANSSLCPQGSINTRTQYIHPTLGLFIYESSSNKFMNILNNLVVSSNSLRSGDKLTSQNNKSLFYNLDGYSYSKPFIFSYNFTNGQRQFIGSFEDKYFYSNTIYPISYGNKVIFIDYGTSGSIHVSNNYFN